MPATITITCPHCRSQLKGPTGLEGKKVRCKGCGQSFVITASDLESAAPDAPSAPAAGSNAPPESIKTVPSHPGPKGGGPGVYAFISDEEAEKAMTDAKTKAPPPTDVKTLKGAKHFGSDGKPYSLTDVHLGPRCPYCAAELPAEDTIICLSCGYHLQTRQRLTPKHTYDITPADVFQWRLPGFIGAALAVFFLAFIAFLWLGLERLAEDSKAWWTIFAGLWFEIWGSVLAGFIIWFGCYLAYHRLVLNPNPPEEEKR
jgi:hypothetical protein